MKTLFGILGFWAVGLFMSVFPFGFIALFGLMMFNSLDGFWFWLGTGAFYGLAVFITHEND